MPGNNIEVIKGTKINYLEEEDKFIYNIYIIDFYIFF